MVLIIGTPKMVPIILGNSHMALAMSRFRSYQRSYQGAVMIPITSSVICCCKGEWSYMSYSLNSLKGFNRGLYRGFLLGLLKGILRV